MWEVINCIKGHEINLKETEEMKKKSHSRSVQLQYCPYCGAMVSPDDLFCSKCGESLFGFDTFPTPGAPSGRRTKRKKPEPHGLWPLSSPVL